MSCWIALHHLHRLLVGCLCLLLLLGCEQPVTPITRTIPTQAVEPIPTTGRSVPTSTTLALPASTPTLTGPDLDATKAALDARWEQELVTAEARLTPAPESPLPTDEPLEPVQMGVSTDCESVYSHVHIREMNCWSAIIDGKYVFVAAGEQTDKRPHDTNPYHSGQGQLIFYIYDEATNTTLASGIHPPSNSGSIRISDVVFPLIHLITEDGTTFTFNMDTRHYE